MKTSTQRLVKKMSEMLSDQLENGYKDNDPVYNVHSDIQFLQFLAEDICKACMEDSLNQEYAIRKHARDALFDIREWAGMRESRAISNISLMNALKLRPATIAEGVSA